MFSYAENLSCQGSISYYSGGMPTEGVSDLLLLFLVAGLLKIGIPCFFSVALISFVSAILSINFIRKLIKPLFLYQELLLILTFLLLPQMIAGLVGYGTVFFGMLVVGSIYFFERKFLVAGFIMAFLACVARPIEGFVPFGLALMYGVALKENLLAKRYLLVFISSAVIFWCWRWWYFDSFMPLPFYVKTQTEKFLFVFNKETLYFLYQQFLPFVFSFALCVIGIWYLPKKYRKMPLMVFVFLFILPLMMYSCADRDMNFALRYQYLPYLGLLILVFYLWEKIPSIQWINMFLFFVLIFRQSSDQWLRAREFNWSNMYPLAVEMAQIVDGKGTLATTEAGILPWQLQMKTLDLWGLNSKELSKRNPTKEDMVLHNPDIIVFHPYADDLSLLYKPLTDTITKNWLQTTRISFDYGREYGYSAYLVPYDKRYYAQINRPWFSEILDKKFGKPSISYRMDVFMVRPNYKYAKEIAQLIYKYGGKEYVPESQK